ncbi:hypothetical protein HY251_17100 [bacterium]|nr:hypothetical protein [bacterium]
MRPEPRESHVVDDTNFLHVIRGLLDPGALRKARAAIVAAESAPATPSLNARAEIQGVAPDAVRVDQRWYDVWRGVDLEPLFSVCRGFDQLVFPPQIRHVKQMTHFVPWHQDIAYQLSLGARGHREVATVFVPLEEKPSRHPTIEFAIVGAQEPVPHVDGGVFHNVLPAPSFEETRSFDLSLGDVLFFGALTPHRTFRRDDHLPHRVSLEFRLARKGGLVRGKDYFDLRTRAFFLAGGGGDESRPTQR